MTKFLSRPFAIVCITLLIPTNAQKANITDPPQDYNVSLNGIIELNCTAVANTFFWRENGQQLDNGINGVDIIIGVVDKARNIRMSTLRVPATDNAAVNYTCIAVTTNPFEQDVSDPAVVRKQGPLESVSNLTVVPINSTSFFISWSPPFTLEGVPILNNTVIITKTTSGENETILERENTTMLYYVFSIDRPDPDNSFTITVVPINGAGPGEDASHNIDFPTFTSSSSFSSTGPGTSLSFPPFSSSNSASPISTSTPETTPDSTSFSLIALIIIPMLMLIVSVGFCITWKIRKYTRRLNDVEQQEPDLPPAPPLRTPYSQLGAVVPPNGQLSLQESNSTDDDPFTTDPKTEQSSQNSNCVPGIIPRRHIQPNVDTSRTSLPEAVPETSPSYKPFNN